MFKRASGWARYRSAWFCLPLFFIAPAFAMAQSAGSNSSVPGSTFSRSENVSVNEALFRTHASGVPISSVDEGHTVHHAAVRTDGLQLLEEELRQQAKLLDEMRAIVSEQQQKIAQLSAGTGNATQSAAATSINITTPATAIPVERAKAAQKSDESPLTFHIGTASITPVGFMDFTTVFRSTTGGSGIGTNFGSIPFKGTSTQGNLSELRFSAQNSRIGFRVDADVAGAKVIGYFESDFLGNNPGNVSVTSNSDTNRLRLYWVDWRKKKLELMGGQSWSMMTPGRKGISPLPADLFYSQDIDVNYQLGLTWARQPQFRIVYHPKSTVALGLSLEEPEQYIGGSGGGGVITLPTNLAASYSTQLNNGGTTLSVPNLMPDFVFKAAFDPKVGKRDLHIEAAGLVREFKVFNPANLQKFTQTGVGGSMNLNFEIVKNVRFVTNNFISGGGGRYIFGQAPDLIVRGNGSLSPIHADSTVTGFEATHKNWLFYGYYGGTYIHRNVTTDLSNGKPVGYGYTGSPNSHNRSIQEATLGLTDTFWRDPKYGALQFMLQYSYLIRKPWFVAPGGLSEARTNMFFINLRYALPGKPPSK